MNTVIGGTSSKLGIVRKRDHCLYLIRKKLGGIRSWCSARRERKKRVIYYSTLLRKGRELTAESRERWFETEGSKAIILALLKGGLKTRDEIVARVPRYHRTSYRHVAFVLDEMTGTNPSMHLWKKDKSGKYELLSM